MPHQSTININYQHKSKRKNTHLHKKKKYEKQIKLKKRMANYRKGERIQNQSQYHISKNKSPLATWQIRQMNLARIAITSIGIIFIIISWFLVATIWSFLLFSLIVLLLLFWFDVKVVSAKFINSHS